MFIGPLLLLVVAPALRKIFLGAEAKPVVPERQSDVEASIGHDGSTP
jgi:heavy metal efflux system protein